MYQWPIQRTSNPYIQEQKHYRKPFWKLQSNMPPHDTLNSPINDISCYFYLCHFWCKVTILVRSLHEDSGEDSDLRPTLCPPWPNNKSGPQQLFPHWFSTHTNRTTPFMIFRITYYLKVRNAINICCTSHLSQTKVKLIVWTLLNNKKKLLDKNLHITHKNSWALHNSK